MVFHTITDLAQYLLQLDPAFPEELGMAGALEVIRKNRHLFGHFEDVCDEHLLELTIQCYVHLGVPEESARRMWPKV